MIEVAGIEEGDYVLEPSAGKGAIVRELLKTKCHQITAVEIVTMNVEALRKEFTIAGMSSRVDVILMDFMEWNTVEMFEFDKVVMNPPFTRQQDVDHIMHAHKFLKPGGVLVSVCSESPFFRTNKKSIDFMNWIEANGGETMQLPEGAFKESGTGVRTRIVKVRK